MTKIKALSAPGFAPRVNHGLNTEYKYDTAMKHSLDRARELYKDVPSLSIGPSRVDHWIERGEAA